MNSSMILPTKQQSRKVVPSFCSSRSQSNVGKLCEHGSPLTAGWLRRWPGRGVPSPGEHRHWGRGSCSVFAVASLSKSGHCSLPLTLRNHILLCHYEVSPLISFLKCILVVYLEIHSLHKHLAQAFWLGYIIRPVTWNLTPIVCTCIKTSFQVCIACARPKQHPAQFSIKTRLPL